MWVYKGKTGKEYKPTNGEDIHVPQGYEVRVINAWAEGV